MSTCVHIYTCIYRFRREFHKHSMNQPRNCCPQRPALLSHVSFLVCLLELPRVCQAVGENGPLAMGEDGPLAMGEDRASTVGENGPLAVGQDGPLAVGEDRSSAVGEDGPSAALPVVTADAPLVAHTETQHDGAGKEFPLPISCEHQDYSPPFYCEQGLLF